MSDGAIEGTLARVYGLTVAFGTGRARRTVVADVGFELRAGRILALVGESGSGKSVTARALLGLAGRDAHVEADRLDIEGRSALHLSEREWRALRGRRIGLVLQDALVSLDPLRPVGAEIRETLDAHGLGTPRERAVRVVEGLAQAGVPEPERRARQRPDQLSGGLRQRALIAAAIAGNPRILVADEPTTALDATVQSQILYLLRSMARAGSAILLITHDIGVVGAVADEVAVMRDGRIVERGAAAHVLARPSHSYTRTLLASLPSARRRPDVPGGRALTVARRHRTVSGPAVVVRNVSKSYRDRTGAVAEVLADVSFSLEPGRTLGLVGESGAGKSTVAGILLGFVTPDSGSVDILGQRWSGVPERERRGRRTALQMVYQDPLGSFDPRLSVGRILAGALRAAGATDRNAIRRRATELLERVGLGSGHLDIPPTLLSGGQRQRVALARALAPEPAILVCDEPVSALDLTTQAQVLDLLMDVQATFDLACVFISHDLAVVRHVSDDILVLHGGRTVEQGPTEAVCAAPRHSYTRQLFAASLTAPPLAPRADEPELQTAARIEP